MKTHPIHQVPRLDRRGFTLTELLVAIVIIVVIAALSMSGFRRARDYADKANSTRNVSQLHLANAAYAADHNGRYVSLYATDEDGKRTGFWFQDPTYLSYLIGDVKDASGKPIRAVPTRYLDPKVIRAKSNATTGASGMAASYGMNDNGLMAQTGPNVQAANHVHRVSQPARSMAFATANDYRINYGSRFSWKEGQVRSTNGSIAYRYGGKALVVYYDGHVGEMSMGDLREIDKSRGGNANPFWKPTAQ